MPAVAFAVGFTFRQRKARNKQGKRFNAFLPAIST